MLLSLLLILSSVVASANRSSFYLCNLLTKPACQFLQLQLLTFVLLHWLRYHSNKFAYQTDYNPGRQSYQDYLSAAFEKWFCLVWCPQ